MATYDKRYGINRETAVLSEWDEIYCNLLKQILSQGSLKENRTGIDTITIPSVSFKLDNVGEKFPILETKKVVIRNALTELLWFYQAQSNDVRWLQDRNNPIWNEWMIDADGIYRVYEPVTENYDPDKEVEILDTNGEKIMHTTAKSLIEGKNIKSAKYFGPEWAYTIGTAYGWIVDRYKRVDEILYKLKNNPNDRRMILSLWQDEFIKTAVLPSCVWNHTLNVTDGKVNMHVSQRSCDTPLGLPFNVSQYAILLNMYAKEAGLEAGTLSWNSVDTHIYVNQIDGVNKQLKEYDDLKRLSDFIQKNPDNKIVNYYRYLQKYYKLSKDEDLKREIDLMVHLLTREDPELVLNPDKSFYEYNNIPNCDKEYLKENPTGNEDIMVRKYTHRPFISIPIAQ